MPKVKIQTSSGTVNINYTISTPTCTSANSIDPSLPTVIFIHPVYIAQIIYQPQFADSQLRRFNLVALDSRGHGDTEGPVPNTFGREMAADDMAAFMDALNLPPCHFVGTSMGACISLQTAVFYPHKVLSLFMISPLPIEEPVDVLEGRQEIYDCWIQGFGDGEVIHEDALLDAISGALQLGFNGSQSSIVTSLIACTYPRALINWAPGKFEELHSVSVKFFKNRKPHPPSLLRRIQCPVNLIHCTNDIAYPLFHVEVLRDRLQGADVDAQISIVEGASHFGHISHAREINSLLYDFLTRKCKCTPSDPPGLIISPFEKFLLSVGWVKEEMESEDEDCF
ncbi:hypothetical protein AX16_004387 [Volvariella volvacea WC 439]|nr:hypothetical protein AX16_004387 [Volvariella volvacea WC 439]